jgi:hypothetical protein
MEFQVEELYNLNMDDTVLSSIINYYCESKQFIWALATIVYVKHKNKYSLLTMNPNTWVNKTDLQLSPKEVLKMFTDDVKQLKYVLQDHLQVIDNNSIEFRATNKLILLLDNDKKVKDVIREAREMFYGK